jgi:flagellar hook-basal body complex protein FliE
VSGVEEANRQVALGVADVDAVATTVADAEIMLETLVTIRDKLVTAYNDLVRTPV